MFDYLNDWHDYLRVVVALISFYAIFTLVRKHLERSSEWNSKTLDYWYALLMWSVAGAVVTIQGIVLDRPFTPAVVVVTAATLVTGKGLHSKGAWGGEG